MWCYLADPSSVCFSVKIMQQQPAHCVCIIDVQEKEREPDGDVIMGKWQYQQSPSIIYIIMIQK